MAYTSQKLSTKSFSCKFYFECYIADLRNVEVRNVCINVFMNNLWNQQIWNLLSFSLNNLFNYNYYKYYFRFDAHLASLLNETLNSRTQCTRKHSYFFWILPCKRSSKFFRQKLLRNLNLSMLKDLTNLRPTTSVFKLTMLWAARSGGGVVDNTLDYQSRIARSIPRFSGLSGETLNRGPVSV